ncbi:hypothetical protein BDY19DRAFT_199631 [Irpex rosettiformis]|uniref:Uncharacterized protein n=1 Tax=Irpex rosettiformis TaxID=378272 RepID=A0ACB8U0S5_9APHY|nr:hypothetical protein BDY19DRAFT_199631 [Irpex rosettiformis]
MAFFMATRSCWPSRRKALKVVELKEILSKAQVTLTGKANKADIIAKILASPEALAVAGGSSDPAPAESTAPAATPKPVAPSIETISSTPVARPPVSQKAETTPITTAPTSAPTSPPESKLETEVITTHTNNANALVEEEDLELAKRRARAARFGIPLVEPTKPKLAVRQLQQDKHSAKPAVLPNDDPDALAARAKRFGIKSNEPTKQKSITGSRGSKRAAPAMETVDSEELERRKKRAERFGLNKTDSTVKA